MFIGTIRVNDTSPPVCIAEDECPCVINGKEYTPGWPIKDPEICDECQTW